jgi:prevent-host-death family protein
MIDLDEAATNLAELVVRAADEEIIIAKAGRPLCRLVPVTKPTGPRPLGLFAGQITIHDDFDAPAWMSAD